MSTNSLLLFHLNTMDNVDQYDLKLQLLLEQMWGEGYLSPGGQTATQDLLQGIDLNDKTVLDIGCGAGGITASLVQDFGATKVTGIDVEAAVCQRAQQIVEQRGLQEQISIMHVAPGPISLPDAHFDIVFSKDAILHITDKQALARDAFRLLKPGGWFVASDWLVHRNPPGPAMQAYLKLEDLDFDMATPEDYQYALEQAGFNHITMQDRNSWYTPVAKHELERLQGDEREAFLQVVSLDYLNHSIATWQAMITALEAGEHCPHHFRGQKAI